jgi:hypothetical protein
MNKHEWNKRREELEAIISRDVQALVEHMGNPAHLTLPLDDGRVLAVGTPAGIRGLLEVDDGAR